MTLLFFDTETTGLVDFKAAPEADHQPHILQLGCLLTDNGGQELTTIDLLIQSPVLCAAEATAVHGITTDMSLEYGVSPLVAAHLFLDLLNQADRIVAHNLSYDQAIMRSLFSRYGLTEHLPSLKDKPGDCTMLLSTSICKIPGPRGFKWPKLSEAYEYFFQETFENAHSAIADVRACKRIYFMLHNRVALS